jgi:hypothetical protein
VTLASYEADGGEQVMLVLNAAVTSCAGGFTYDDQDGEAQKIVKVAAETAPQGADEAVALTLRFEQDGVQAPTKVVVVRKGSALACFSAKN